MGDPSTPPLPPWELVVTPLQPQPVWLPRVGPWRLGSSPRPPPALPTQPQPQPQPHTLPQPQLQPPSQDVPTRTLLSFIPPMPVRAPPPGPPPKAKEPPAPKAKAPPPPKAFPAPAKLETIPELAPVCLPPWPPSQQPAPRRRPSGPGQNKNIGPQEDDINRSGLLSESSAIGQGCHDY